MQSDHKVICHGLYSYVCVEYWFYLKMKCQNKIVALNHLAKNKNHYTHTHCAKLNPNIISQDFMIFFSSFKREKSLIIQCDCHKKKRHNMNKNSRYGVRSDCEIWRFIMKCMILK